MKLNKDEVVLFLRAGLPKQYILKSFLFGSVASGKAQPSDCDLFIVTSLTPNHENWEGFINEVLSLKQVFYHSFHLPLNLTINIEKEFAEYSEFKERVLTGIIINIYG